MRRKQGKAYKFAEGSGEEGIPSVREGPNENIDAGSRERAMAAMAAAQEAPAREPSFKEAFAAARAAGEPVFTWKGKKFSTDTSPAGASRAAPRAAPAPAAYSNEGRNAPVPPRATGMGGDPGLQAGAAAAARKLQSGMPPRGMADGGAVGFAGGGIMPPQGARPQGMRPQGMPPQGAPAGGMPPGMPPQGMPPGGGRPAPVAGAGARPMPQGARPMPQGAPQGVPPGMAKGGSIDGCATRGKTRARRG
jgi:hypothetical protein